MTTSQKSLLVGGLLLGAGLCLPRVTYAAPSCNNGNLLGTYNAQITSLSFMNVLTTLNTTAATSTGTTGGAGSTGSTGSTGSASPASTASTPRTIHPYAQTGPRNQPRRKPKSQR